MLAVYGEWDPWTYAAIPQTDGIHVFTVDEGDHTAAIYQLPEDELLLAKQTIADRLGLDLPTQLAITGPQGPRSTSEDLTPVLVPPGWPNGSHLNP